MYLVGKNITVTENMFLILTLNNIDTFFSWLEFSVTIKIP